MTDQEYQIKLLEYQMLSNQINYLQTVYQNAALGLQQQPGHIEILSMFHSAEEDLKAMDEPFNKLKGELLEELAKRHMEDGFEFKLISKKLLIVPQVPRPAPNPQVN